MYYYFFTQLNIGSRNYIVSISTSILGPKPLAEINSLRLVSPDNGSKVGPTAKHFGVLEIYQYGRWGIVCADRFPENAGDISCIQLGFAGLSELTIRYRNGFDERMCMYMLFRL